jgi:hypothetical protein
MSQQIYDSQTQEVKDGDRVVLIPDGSYHISDYITDKKGNIVNSTMNDAIWNQTKND